MSETALALVQSITAVEFFKPGASKGIIERLENEARETAKLFDVSTPAGQDGLRSLAASIARAKNKIDKERLALVSGEKARLKVIDTEGGIVWDKLEALQKEVRQPLTDFENAEKDRIAGHEAALAALAEAGERVERNWQAMSVEDMRASLAHITASRRDWQEFLARAKVTVVTAIGQIKTAIAQREKLDADAAELEALRAAAAVQAQKDRDTRIAQEAREAAEALARERAAEQARVAEAERQRVELERAEAEAKAKQAEAHRVAAEAKAVQDAADAAEALRVEQERSQEAAKQAEAQRVAEAEESARRIKVAEAEKLEAEAKAAREAEEATQRHAEAFRLAQERLAQQKREGEAAAAAAAQRAETERQAAIVAERERIEAERQAQADRIAEETRKREQDKAHKASVHDEAEAALIAGGMGKTAARMAVTIIAREQVPHIKIAY